MSNISISKKKKTRKECGENDALLHENGVVTVIVLVAPSSGIYSVLLAQNFHTFVHAN